MGCAFWGAKQQYISAKGAGLQRQNIPWRPDIARTIKDEVTATNEEGRRLIDQLLTNPWLCFFINGVGDGISLHAITMLKLKNGNIFYMTLTVRPA